MRKIYQANTNLVKAGQTILTPEKIDFKYNLLADIGGPVYNDKSSIQQDYITIINVYNFNDKASKYIEQVLTELKGETIPQSQLLFQ